MKRLLTAAALSALFATSLGAAVLNGKVMFLTRRGQQPVPNETLVWLDATGRMPRRPASRFTMTTRSKTFLPHVLAIPAGSTIQFPNEDPISHNLFSLTSGNTFDLGLYRRGAGRVQKFESPGVVNIYCNVHPNMSAVVHVMNTPWYGFADAQGNYSFEVPPGRYRITAWNEQGGSKSSEVEIGENGQVTGATLLTIDGSKFRAGQHMNKHGKPYRPARDY